MTILDELDPAVLEQLTEQEKQQLLADAAGLQGAAARTHLAVNRPDVPLPSQNLPRLNLQPGQMFSYSTRGPSRWNPDTDVAIETPTGDTVYAPENARNISMVQGPAGPSQSDQQAVRDEQAQRDAMAQMLSGIPIRNAKDAETAMKMGILFKANEMAARLRREGRNPNDVAMITLPMFTAAGVPTSGISRMFGQNQNRFMNVGGRLYRTDNVTGEAVPVTEPVGISADTAARLAAEEKNRSAITPTAALNVVADPMKWSFAQNALGPQATNLVNIARSGMGQTQPVQTVPTESQTAQGKPLDRATAQKILNEAGGDPRKATEIAKQRGYKI